MIIFISEMFMICIICHNRLCMLCQYLMVFLDQLTEEQNNIDALPGETVTIITELPEDGLDVVWLKNNVPFSMTDTKYTTIHKDCSYQLVIPDVTVEDSGDYKIQGEEYESTVSLTVNG